MIEGLYAAAAGMIANEDRVAAIANNVANSSTPGFRRQSAVQNGFYEILFSKFRHPFWLNRDPGPGGGLKIIETFTDTRGGPVTATGNPLNLAIDGPGFFTVRTPAGDRYTRDGSFTVDKDGDLATSEGHKVLSAAGATIDASGTNVHISNDGRVWVDGQPTGQLQITEFEDPHMLNRAGDNLFQASDAALARSAPPDVSRVESKALEMSNVQVPHEMASMTLALRMYTANQKVISTIDETMGRLINEVGAPI